MGTTSPDDPSSLTIIRFNKDITAEVWRDALLRDSGNLFTLNSRTLVLTGVHGDGDTGGLGAAFNANMKGNFMRQGVVLKNKLKKELKNKFGEGQDLFIHVEDIAKHALDGDPESTTLDEEKFIEAVKLHRPTILVLAFCQTLKSELNDILRRAGIYATLVLAKDRELNNEGRYDNNFQH